MTRYVKILNLVLCFALSVHHMAGQDTESLSFYYNPVQGNPALAGSEGTGKLRLIYRDYYPGNGLNLYSVSCSYDSFLAPIHGGLGIYLSDDLLGDLINNFKAGAAYSYHLRASRDLYINAGFLASVIHRRLDAGNIVLPDQIDPIMGAVLPSGEVIVSESRTVFDAGIGFLFIFRDYHAGISVNHIFRPDITGNGFQESAIGRRLSIHGGGTLYPGSTGLMLNPGFIINIQDNNMIFALGASLSYKGLSINILPFFDPEAGLNFIQSGLHFTQGRIELGYNYNFNPFRNERLLPFTLSNQVYIAVSLGDIKKSDVIKAIKYPKM